MRDYRVNLRPRGSIGTALACACPVALLLAGTGKVWDVGAFAESLAAWPLVPPPRAGALALAVISIELGIGAAWVLGLRRSLMEVLAPALLILFSGAYAAHLVVLGRPPPCNCLGVLMAIRGMEDDARWVLGRNSVLIGAGLIGGFIRRGAAVPRIRARPRGPTAEVQRNGSQKDARVAAGGFTLLEVVIAVAAIAILLATALPSLTRMRHSANVAGSLSNLRQHTAVFTMYTNDWRDSFPWFTHPDAVVRLRYEHDLWLSVHYWFAYATWNTALAPGYYDSNPNDDSLFPIGYGKSRGRESTRRVFTPYWYSSAFLADPLYWGYQTRRGKEQWRATRSVEVRFSSKKALLYDSWTGFQQMGPSGLVDSNCAPPIGFVDGSARSIGFRSIRPGYWWGTGGGPVYAAWLHDQPAMCTLDGVRGRDVE